MSGHKKTFARVGGSIGRADTNSWVLPDMERIVSSTHAEIIFSNDHYILIDKSTNGTFINGADSPLGSGQQVQLNDGDIVGVGLFQVKVTLQANKLDLPTGLDNVDFLDDGDKTTIGSMAADVMPEDSPENNQFDQWLEPENNTSGSKDIWGAIVPSSNLTFNDSSASVDPLAAMTSPGIQPDVGGVLDPLAALSGSNPSQSQPVQTGGWNDQPSHSGGGGDDWWLSESDNAPVVNQSMVVPQVAPQVASPTPPQPAVQPVQQPIQQPQQNSFQTPPIPQPAAQPVQQPAQPTAPVEQPLQDMSLDQLLNPSATAEIQQPVAPAIQPEPVPQQPPAQQPIQTPVAPTPPPAQAAITPAQPAQGTTPSNLAAHLNIQGLDANQMAQLDAEAAALIRETVNRLMDLLRARNSVKNELRVERTMIQTQDNNPLKFSAAVDDALGMMFNTNGRSNGGNAFMSPSEAINDSFDNISDHQVAVLVAMRNAYESMMSRFSPENLIPLFERMGSKGLTMNKKAKNWEAYQSWFKQLQKDQEETYNRMFGEVFADSYEKKLSELKSVRNLQ